MTTRDQAAILKLIYETSLDGCWLVSEDRRLLDVNAAACAMLGYTRDEMLGLGIRDIEAEETHAEYEEHNTRIRLNGGDRFFARHRHKNGSAVEVEVSLRQTPLLDGRYACFIRDLTAQRAAERRAAELSRLAALGTLVAGLAHEVNNPLTAVLANQSVAVEELSALLRAPASLDRNEIDQTVAGSIESLRDAVEGSHRIARIVKDLSLFGHPDPRRAPVSPGEVVGDALRALPPRLGERARFEVTDRGAPQVMASAGQLVQVVVHLVTNAADSIPDGRIGTVRVGSYPGEGGSARIEVRDDGCGIPPSVLHRIFEPFYTARRANGGTGLGLAVCHAIVTAHGGNLTVESEVGKGSMFRVELPEPPARVSRGRGTSTF